MDFTPQPYLRRSRLAGDASQRSYYRLWDASENTAILVSYPPADRWQLGRDLEVRQWCASHGLIVPELFKSDSDAGWAVLEDLGAEDAEQVLAQTAPADKLDLARRLLEPLVVLAEIPVGDLPPWNLPLGEARLRWELSGFEMWFVRHHRRSAALPEIGTWLDEVARRVAAHPRRICHRDYHLNNLFFGERDRVIVIDYQDILVGPDTYDIVSLVGERGLPRELDDSDRIALTESWARSTRAAPGWHERFRWTRIQRGLKVLGTFARLSASGAPDYRTWMSELGRSLGPELKTIAAPTVVLDLLLD